MRKSHLVLFSCIGALSIILVVVNAWLKKQNDQLREQLTTGLLDAQRRTNTPDTNTNLPTLMGHDLDGKVMGLDLQLSAPKMVLLLFSPDCKYCEQNWKYWSKLATVSRAVVPIAVTETVSKEYMARHWPSDHLVLVGLDPKIQTTMKMHAVPQTILIVQGKVHETLLGVLSDQDIVTISKWLQSS